MRTIAVAVAMTLLFVGIVAAPVADASPGSGQACHITYEDVASPTELGGGQVSVPSGIECSY